MNLGEKERDKKKIVGVEGWIFELGVGVGAGWGGVEKKRKK
ncbi:MAG: hypothetical protein Devi2KO_39950 [Devosia indica]